MAHPRDSEPTDPDALLLARVGEGDVEAYRELVIRYGARLHQYALRLLREPAESEDVLQEAWLRVWLRSGEYQPAARVTTWLHRIVHNLAVDRLRVRGRWVESDEEQHEAPESAGQGALLQAKRRAEALHEALGRLPERQAAAIALVHLNGLSAEEAREILNVTPEALESLLARGRRSLKRELLQEKDGRG